jgi:RNA polymerase sigma-70 factor, ECF subfamily
MEYLTGPDRLPTMKLTSFFRGSREFESRIEGHRAALFRAAYAWSHDRALADDLAQETLARALAHAGQLRDPERLRSWLFGILANGWRDHLRALRPSVDIDTLEDECFCADPTPDEAYGRREIVARVRAAVALLPAGQRQVLTLVDLEEFSYSEVASILGIPIGTVMSRLCRARLALRDRLLQAAASQGDPLPVSRLRSAK